MNKDRLRALIEGLPDGAKWPELGLVFDRAGSVPRPDWELPLLACVAVGGQQEIALTGAAAIACLQISIILVDDMLDNDPRGEHNVRGHGPTANLALAFQSAAFQLVEKANIAHAQRTRLTSALSHIALATSVGQNFDIQNTHTEKEYWEVVGAKSTPFYGGALQVGGIIGGADPSITDGLYQLGVLLGEIIQIEDDLMDAFQSPANSDWIEGRNNLLILFARTADYTQKNQFLALLSDCQNRESLAEAQKILISSGAVSFCAYLLIEKYNAARQLLNELKLNYPTPLLDILDDYADSLLSFLQLSGIKVTKDIFANR